MILRWSKKTTRWKIVAPWYFWSPGLQWNEIKMFFILIFPLCNLRNTLQFFFHVIRWWIWDFCQIFPVIHWGENSRFFVLSDTFQGSICCCSFLYFEIIRCAFNSYIKNSLPRQGPMVATVAQIKEKNSSSQNKCSVWASRIWSPHIINIQL